MSLSLLIASISVTIVTMALNLFFHSKKILEKKDKLCELGEKMKHWWILLFFVGVILVINGSIITIIRNTYIAVGISIIFTSWNFYVIERMFRKPNSGGKRFGKIVGVSSQILGCISLLAMFTALILAGQGN